MKHAGAAALDGIEPLLTRVRALPGLKEKSRGTFYLKSRAALHFHEDPAGLFADVRGPADPDFIRLQVDTTAGADTLIAHLAGQLAAG
jgi:hypothetical protein